MTDSISGVIGTATGDFTDQLWLVAPIGLGIFALYWGLPKAKGFLKKLAG